MPTHLPTVTAKNSLDVQSHWDRAQTMAHIGSLELDFVRQTSFVSPRLCDMLGQPVGWAPPALELLRLHPEHEQDNIQQLWRGAFKHRRTHIQYQCSVIHGGQTRHLHYQGEISYSDDGEPTTLFAVVQDLTQHKQSEAMLQAGSNLKALEDATPDTIAHFDLDCRRTYVNPAMLRLSGVPAEAFLGRKPTDDSSSDQARELEAELRTCMQEGKRRRYLYTYYYFNERGMIRGIADLAIVPTHNAEGEVVGAFTIGRDISALKEAQSQLEDAQRMARMGHWSLDLVLKEAQISSVGRDLLGLPQDKHLSFNDLLDHFPASQVSGIVASYQQALEQQREEFRHDASLTGANGSLNELHSWVRIEYTAKGRPVRVMGVTQDMTALRTLERQTHQLAYYDALTHLPNRAMLRNALQQAISDSTRHQLTFGLVILGIDHFQKVNDSLGQPTGDALLKAIASRLTQHLRGYDTVARIGGDEFAIVVPKIRQALDVGVTLSHLKNAFRAPIHLADTEIMVTASAGISVFPFDGVAATELIAHADAAMHHAKRCGRDNFQYYSPELTSSALERLKIESDLRKAVVRSELELFYQPKVDLTTGRMVGAEALMRWRHPTRGLVPPDQFIGIAEDTGLILGMGEWALHSAFAAAKRWNDQAAEPLKIAVNLSPKQFYNNDLVATVYAAMEATGCKAEWIELEITESLLLNDPAEVRSTLQRLHHMGISIAIDDFGTGYSALSYLARFPVNVLKIDRSFIRELTTNPDSAALVQAIVSLARGLRMTLVAEGVETGAQRDELKRLGCELAQGFLYSKPVPVDQFDGLITSWQPPA
ncbi:sensor domain-containing protein [Aquabacterium sp.]|uniref:sensor domain-containing protein n=1 Tax=Aquabacterium sp. TaxID=1872578 RepID=UPI003D6D39D3